VKQGRSPAGEIDATGTLGTPAERGHESAEFAKIGFSAHWSEWLEDEGRRGIEDPSRHKASSRSNSSGSTWIAGTR
jgi:hypothetical protein